MGITQTCQNQTLNQKEIVNSNDSKEQGSVKTTNYPNQTTAGQQSENKQESAYQYSFLITNSRQSNQSDQNQRLVDNANQEQQSKVEQNEIQKQNIEVKIKGTKHLGKAPIFNPEDDSIHNTLPSIKENYEPWLKKKIDELGTYQPPQKFVDDQSQFVINTILPDQSRYEGFMKNDKQHGYGINLFKSELFEGSFQDGKRRGWGRIITKDKFQSGYWENDKITKDMEWQEKDFYYKGECKNSLPNGFGNFRRKNISNYEGDFVDGRMQGKGKFEDLVKNVKYEGEFLMEKYHGYGTYFYSNGKKYIGNFKNSQFDGQGEMFWPDNRYYKGQFVNGLFDGLGYFIDSDQSIFDGYFKNGKKNGKGRLINKNIEVSGIWENDEFQEGK